MPTGLEITPSSAVPPKSPKRFKQDDPKVMHNIGDELLDEDKVFQYDVSELEIGSGLFVPIEPNQTIDHLMLKVNATVHQLNEYWSVFVRNDEGERILDVIMVEEIQRNDDKSIKLGMDGKAILGASQKFTPRRIQLRQYAAKAVTADDKFSEDGALIVRVF